MRKIGTKLGKRVKATIDDLETRALAAEGRRAVRAKVATAKRVTKKALKAGAIAGVVVAATVLVRERRKRRKLES
jgi:hypothetical protein